MLTSSCIGRGKTVTFCAKTRTKAASFTTPLSLALANRMSKSMLSDQTELPEFLRKFIRASMLDDLKNQSSLDVFELDLFEWYVRETDELIEQMFRAEQDYVREQIQRDQEHINDSGFVAADYYLKRVRYSHVIYLASVLETFLERECGRLRAAVGEDNIPFELKELSGDQWSTKRKYLERYGCFKVSAAIWKKAQDLTALRNHLVHDNGSLLELKDQEKQRFSKFPGIKFDQTQVIVEAEYTHHAFSAVKELCSEIDEKVGAAIYRVAEDRRNG